MTCRRIVHIGFALMICAVLGGCTLLYNGAFSAPRSRRDEMAYQEFRRRQMERMHNQQAPANQKSYAISQQRTYQTGQLPTHQTFENTNRAAPTAYQPRRRSRVQFQNTPPMEPTGHPGHDTQLTSHARGVTIGPLGLYGQLPEVAPGNSSPLDSPDNLRQVTFATEGADFDPDIDPTGTLLVYASTQHRATADLYIKRIEGSALQQLTNDPANDVMPTFSPDGKRIAFASDRGGNWDIYIMDTTGGQAVQLTSDATHDLSPSFSSDGKQIVYCTYGSQSGQWELVIINVENPATKRFVGYGLFPDWSPVDNRIIFQRARERGTRWFSVWTIELVNGEGLRPTEIAASSNAATISPAWSPDAKHIAFSTIIDPENDDQVKPVQADVWIINSDGSGRANLTNSQFANLHPTWSNDKAIFFVSNRAKNSVDNIWAIRPDRAMRVSQPENISQQPSAMRTAPKNQRTLDLLIDDSDAMVPTR